MIAEVQEKSLSLMEKARCIFPGLLLSSIVAMAAQFVSEHYNTPAMFLALLFGMSMNFLSEEKTRVAPGILFTATIVLKFGIILLGARISADILMVIGWKTVLLLVAAMVSTIFLGYLLGKIMRKPADFSILTAGAVSICGASAALAIASVLPKTEKSDQNLFFTVLSVTMLSTIAMILYPTGLKALAFSDLEAGTFIGATVHHVAQVVGAGFSISETAGETATLVKLIRVSFLAPIVVVISLLFRGGGSSDSKHAGKTILPAFVICFLALAVMNSFGLVPDNIKSSLEAISRWALLTAIAAVGIKTSLRELLNFGYSAIALVVLETAFLAVFIMSGMQFL